MTRTAALQPAPDIVQLKEEPAATVPQPADPIVTPDTERPVTSQENQTATAPSADQDKRTDSDDSDNEEFSDAFDNIYLADTSVDADVRDAPESRTIHSTATMSGDTSLSAQLPDIAVGLVADSTLMPDDVIQAPVNACDASEQVQNAQKLTVDSPTTPNVGVSRHDKSSLEDNTAADGTDWSVENVSGHVNRSSHDSTERPTRATSLSVDAVKPSSDQSGPSYFDQTQPGGDNSLLDQLTWLVCQAEVNVQSHAFACTCTFTMYLTFTHTVVKMLCLYFRMSTG